MREKTRAGSVPAPFDQDPDAELAELRHEVMVLRRRVAMLERFAHLHDDVAEEFSLQAALDAVTAAALDISGVCVALLYLVAPDDPSCLRIASWAGVALGTGTRDSRPSDVGLAGRAFTTKTLVVENHYTTSPTARPEVLAWGVTAAMGAPIQRSGKTRGVIVVARTDRQPFTTDESYTLERFAEHAAIAIEDVRGREALHRSLDRAVYQATHDPLTGLANRALFLRQLERAVRLPLDASAAPGLVYLDIDGFKAINDTWGHAAGDVVLTAVGRRLQDAVRGRDLPARLGGDEYAVLVPATDANGLAVLSRRITTALDDLRAPAQSGEPVSVSIGTALATEADTPTTLLKAADAAMYRHKQRTRRATRTGR